MNRNRRGNLFVSYTVYPIACTMFLTMSCPKHASCMCPHDKGVVSFGSRAEDAARLGVCVWCVRVARQ